MYWLVSWVISYHLLLRVLVSSTRKVYCPGARDLSSNLSYIKNQLLSWHNDKSNHHNAISSNDKSNYHNAISSNTSVTIKNSYNLLLDRALLYVKQI